MAKKSAIARNDKRVKLSAKFASKRATLKAIIHDKNISLEDRFVAQMKLDKIPKNACPVRIHNRCELTGRPKGFYRKFKISRIALRELGNYGLIPGLSKSSW